jgi:hypothetical protein
MATERPTWSRVLDSIPAARPYIETIAEYASERCPSRHREMILTVSTACVVRAKRTGLATPLVDLGLYLRSWGMPQDTAQRFCRRLGVAMEVPRK